MRKQSCSSADKESVCNAGDPGSIPGSGRSPGEGKGCPLQPFPWASLVAQMVKNPPAMRETWVQSLGWKDPLEKGKAAHCSIAVAEASGLILQLIRPEKSLQVCQLDTRPAAEPLSKLLAPWPDGAP